MGSVRVNWGIQRTLMRCWCLKHFIQPHNLATYTYWMPFAHPNTQVRGRDGDATAVSVAGREMKEQTHALHPAPWQVSDPHPRRGEGWGNPSGTGVLLCRHLASKMFEVGEELFRMKIRKETTLMWKSPYLEARKCHIPLTFSGKVD